MPAPSKKSQSSPTEAAQRRAVTILRKHLLGWFEKNQRTLPWRGEGKSAYEIWVSEIMLQQTRASVVVDYYRRFLERLPTLESLASAPEDVVLGLWQGLGYYSRAKRLHGGARHVQAHFGGKIPAAVDDLLRIPGVGRYTAGAIASQAYSVRAPIVDGNVQRVLTRVFAIPGDPAKRVVSDKIWGLAEEFVADGEPRLVNPALMELGALVCTPKKPSCSTCPWRRECGAFSGGEVERYPELAKRAKSSDAHLFVFVFEHRGRYLVEKVEPEARWWSGLHLFPTVDPRNATDGAVSKSSRVFSPQAPMHSDQPVAFGSAMAELLFSPESIAEVTPLRSRKHQVTRYRIQLQPLLVRLKGRLPKAPPHADWIERGALEELAWPGPWGRLIREEL